MCLWYGNDKLRNRIEWENKIYREVMNNGQRGDKGGKMIDGEGREGTAWDNMKGC